jgi:hypothetical protein
MFKLLKKLIQSLIPKKHVVIPVIVPPFEKGPIQTLPGNDWKVVSAIEPDDREHILKVTYTNELGMEKVITCMVVFEHNNEYKLVSPELGSGIILQKANLTDLHIEKVISG